MVVHNKINIQGIYLNEWKLYFSKLLKEDRTEFLNGITEIEDDKNTDNIHLYIEIVEIVIASLKNGIKNRINKGTSVREMLNSIMWNRQITRKNKLLKYNSIVKSTVTYGAETWKFNKQFRIKTYVDGNGLFEEIGEVFKIRKK